MNPTGKIISLVYALILLGGAFSAVFDVWGFAFAIGDGGGQPGPAMSVLLIATLLGGAGLAISALGSWTRWPAVGLIAFVSALLVLPAAALFAWANGHALWWNTRTGAWRSPLWEWGLTFLPPFLGLLAIVFSWLRFRRFSKPAGGGTGAAGIFERLN
ncbi:MAG TPA: hypothetical protein VKB38_13010 [Terracidiphilus sp.]|nr:hypothetical protein [Terracidiphilus sp.]